MSVLDWRPGCDVATLEARAALLAELRRFFAIRGVLEVDTPVLARRTVTDPAIESLRSEAPPPRAAHEPPPHGWFLQSSPEFHMKRLLAAGAPCMYRIGPAFRREERGRWHNPEFTLLEWYRVGFDLPRLIEEVRELIDGVLGPAEPRIIPYRKLIEERLGFDPFPLERQRLLEGARGTGMALPQPLEMLGDRELLDLLFGEAVERLGPGRVFVTEFPVEQAALARCRRDAAGFEVADRCELIIDGIELANGYHELRDAKVLAARMAADRAWRRRAGRFLPEPDERLLAAMRHGLPDCAGIALGFDRLLALRLGTASLDATLPFSIERS